MSLQRSPNGSVLKVHAKFRVVMFMYKETGGVWQTRPLHGILLTLTACIPTAITTVALLRLSAR
jgi:hypothetical protein